MIGNDETHKKIYAHQTSKSVKSNNSVMFITELSLIIFFGKIKLTALVQFVIFLFAIFHDRENTFLNRLIKFALEKACVNRVRVSVNFEVLFWTFFKLRFFVIWYYFSSNISRSCVLTVVSSRCDLEKEEFLVRIK